MLSAALVPLSLVLLVSARLHHSRVPEDPFAFPKYRVSFLNGLPVLNETAERWLQHGLRGGELEFLEQPWNESPWPNNPPKGIGSSDDRSPDAASSNDSRYTLQHMKLGPKSSYLCLIPPPPQEPPVVDDPQAEVVTPVHSWSLLQPLSGKCLYLQQGWFTYSYCHNSHVRQFHELHRQQMPTTGEYKPEEDPEWEAYTLGRAPPTLEAGAELTTAEAAAAANLELARGAGSRYLVQRWGDGTYCDKMGRKREVEIQFHCSMTMTDTILFVKETQTCHYVLHIATPRLCGEPGFKSRVDAEEEHYIRCREVVGPEDFERVDRSIPAASQPIKRAARPQKNVIAPPPTPEHPSDNSHEDGSIKKAAAESLVHSDVFRKALERLLARRGEDGAAAGDSHVFVERLPDGEGEYLVELIDLDDFPEGEEGFAEGEDGYDMYVDDGFEDRLASILRAAGHQLAEDFVKSKGRGSDAEDEEGETGADGNAQAKDKAMAKAKAKATKPREEL
ncbi:glucosidase II beta subunit-like protein-domain-containing protein [Daedaleopsis nitida]|nr:glucosidase II beta subunit-like protein-domain-containing protein [Daedaleopsis nitida]